MSRRRTGSCVLVNSVHRQYFAVFLYLQDPNGRIPILVDNNKSPPFTVMETSAELLYLLKEYDYKDEFGFKDDLERSEALQWLFFWHGSGTLNPSCLFPKARSK